MFVVCCRDIPGCLDVASQIKKQIEEFRPYIPLIQGLRNPGMRNRCGNNYSYVALYSLWDLFVMHKLFCSS